MMPDMGMNYRTSYCKNMVQDRCNNSLLQSTKKWNYNKIKTYHAVSSLNNALTTVN